MIAECRRILKPGGVLLATVPCAGRVDSSLGRTSEWWRWSARALHDQVAAAFGDNRVRVRAHGGRDAVAAFLLGLAAEEVGTHVLGRVDSDAPLVLSVRAVGDRRGGAGMTSSQTAIVITCYELGETIPAAVASAAAQTAAPLEIVLVDDGSQEALTRHVIDRLDEHGESVTVIKSKHRGVAHARNLGIGATTAPQVVLLDGDDLFEPTYLEKADEVLRERTDLSFVCCAIQAFGRASYRWKPPPYTIADAIGRGACGHISTVFRREVWESVGGFDESLPAYEDVDFWLHALELGFKGVILDDALLRYRVRQGSRYHSTVVSGEYLRSKEMLLAKHCRVGAPAGRGHPRDAARLPAGAGGARPLARPAGGGARTRTSAAWSARSTRCATRWPPAGPGRSSGGSWTCPWNPTTAAATTRSRTTTSSRRGRTSTSSQTTAARSWWGRGTGGRRPAGASTTGSWWRVRSSTSPTRPPRWRAAAMPCGRAARCS